MKKGEKNIYAYGETPLTTLEKICEKAQVKKGDFVIELGSGRGRTCFWLNIIRQCKVKGVEYIPEFVEIANHIKSKHQLKDIEFECVDMLKTDYSRADVVYLYGTLLSDNYIKRLVEKFKSLPKGAKVITVSYPLTDYSSDSSLFEIVNRFKGKYPWGEADIFLQIKK